MNVFDLQALRDHDHIWGIVSKTAVNQDGRSVTPITKPSRTQQEELLRRIYSESDLVSVQYIEAHGTGTPAGDPTEAESISNVIAKAKPPGSGTLWIGSVKSNIGHTESAAGVAGLIKVLLMMKHQTIVPSVFYSEESASIDVKELKIEIPREAERWHASGARVAGVNNFGFGGTNAHAIVKQYKRNNPERKHDGKQAKYFVMSANSLKSLTLTTEDTIRHLEMDNGVNLDSLVYTSACRRSHLKHRYRKAIMVSALDDLQEKLKASVGKNISPSFSDAQLVFVFCGNGVTYQGMCRQLLQKEPFFRNKIKEIAQLYQRLSPLNILDILACESEFSNNNPQIVQPLLFAIQVGINTLLNQWGVKPDAVLGHSFGEIAAAHCSGLLSLEDALKVLHFRSTLQTKVTGGKMLVVSNMSVSDVTAHLPKYTGKLWLAAFNSPQSCTISGDADAIESLHRELRTSTNSQSLFLRVLDVPAAYHSHMMDPILAEVKERIGSLQINNTNTELFSTVTGNKVHGNDFCNGEYWARNIREPVAFEQAVRSATKGKTNTVFVEIGPKRALQRNIMETLGNNTTVFASVQPEKDHETITLVSKLFEVGVNVNWNTFYRGHETMPLPIPKYQFDLSDRDVVIGAAQNNKGSHHPVLCHTGSESNIFTCDLKSNSSFYLKEHKHNGVPIIPGAFYAELGLAAFIVSVKPKVPLCSLQISVSFHSPFVLAQNSPEMKVQLEPTEEETKFTVLSPSAVYASGTVVSKKERLIEQQFIALNSIYKRCKSVVNSREFYGYLSQGGFQYGDVFQNKADVYYGEELKEAYAFVRVPEKLRSQLHEYCIHPVMLDFLMQLLPVTVKHIFAGRPGFPAKIGGLTVYEPLQDEMIIYLRAIDVGADHFEVCGCFADKEERVLVEVKHVIFRYLGIQSHVVEEYFYHNAFSVVTGSITSAASPRALVFSDHIGISQGLKPYLDSRSSYISLTHADDFLSQGFPSLLKNLKITDIDKNFDEVLFLWGKENLSTLASDAVLQNLARCCEIFRQVVLELKRINFPNSIRAVTYCSSDITVHEINPGFALVGMTRAFAAEMPYLQFQLIDMNSTSSKGIAALYEVLRSYPCSKYPELVVKDGLVMKPAIVRTPADITDFSEANFNSTNPEPCIFQTADAHEMTQISAIYGEEEAQPVSDTFIEIQPSKICVHSSDYFPVSSSHLKFGQTLYWNKYSSQKYKIVALDFCGTVTAIGKDVRKFKVGDRVACCYPVIAASRVRVPEDVCYNTERFPFLQKTPCVSYFVIAWEILCRALPRTKNTLGIISSVPNCALVKVLQLTFHKSGWSVTVGGKCNDTLANFNQVNTVVILPPCDETLIAKICKIPGVQKILLICETQSFFAQDMYETVKESVCVHTIQVPEILQKGSLSVERPHINQWLKSLNLSRKLSLESVIFQGVKSDSLKWKPLSYFNSKKPMFLALDKDGGHELSDIPIMPTKKQLFKKRAVYIVAGGLSGLGFETVKFISQRGGKYVVILSRSKPSPDVEQEIDNVEKQCRNCITAMECDVSVSESVNKVVSAIGQKFPGCPIRGVFHSAVVLHDGLIETLDLSLYEKVFRPKVNGVLNLHHATKKFNLDYFVCYSSISAFLGNASQTNYAAANTFLDMFCHYRRKLGLPGQSINWGALNLGLLLNKEHLQRFLEAKGILVLDVPEIHQCLEKCLVLNRPQQAVCRFDFRNIRYNILSQNAALANRLSELVNEALQKSKESEQTKETQAVSPREYVISLLSETIGMDRSELRDESPLSSLGIDSMQAMTVQNLIFQEKGVNLPLVKLLDPNATISSVIGLLSEEHQSGYSSHIEVTVPDGDANYISTRL